QQTANLEIKPNHELSKPVSSDPSEKLIRAAELENAKYYAEPAALYRQLRDADPRDSRLGYHLVWLYGSAGLVTAAGDELAKLAPIKCSDKPELRPSIPSAQSLRCTLQRFCRQVREPCRR